MSATEEKKEEKGGVGWRKKGELLVLDGSVMEGGGQILRNSVSLSCLLGSSVVVENIRGKRKKPGLGHQHLCGIELVRFVFFFFFFFFFFLVLVLFLVGFGCFWLFFCFVFGWFWLFVVLIVLYFFFFFQIIKSLSLFLSPSPP